MDSVKENISLDEQITGNMNTLVQYLDENLSQIKLENSTSFNLLKEKIQEYISLQEGYKQTHGTYSLSVNKLPSFITMIEVVLKFFIDCMIFIHLFPQADDSVSLLSHVFIQFLLINEPLIPMKQTSLKKVILMAHYVFDKFQESKTLLKNTDSVEVIYQTFSNSLPIEPAIQNLTNQYKDFLNDSSYVFQKNAEILEIIRVEGEKKTSDLCQTLSKIQKETNYDLNNIDNTTSKMTEQLMILYSFEVMEELQIQLDTYFYWIKKMGKIFEYAFHCMNRINDLRKTEEENVETILDINAEVLCILTTTPLNTFPNYQRYQEYQFYENEYNGLLKDIVSNYPSFVNNYIYDNIGNPAYIQKIYVVLPLLIDFYKESQLVTGTNQEEYNEIAKNIQFLKEYSLRNENLHFFSTHFSKEFAYINDDLDNMTDLFVSMTTDSNLEYLMVQMHTLNVYGVYQPLFNLIFDEAVKENEYVSELSERLDRDLISQQKEEQQNARLRRFGNVTQLNPDYKTQEMYTEVEPVLVESKTNVAYRGGDFTNTYTITIKEDVRPNLVELKKRKMVEDEPLLKKKQLKKEDTKLVCDGVMVSPDITSYPNLYNPGFLTASISKTYDELSHDFASKLNSSCLALLKKTYRNVIDRFVKQMDTQISMNSNLELGDELKKIKQFIDYLHIADDNEWTYYTSALQYIDKVCSKLEHLTIVKMAKVEDYDYLRKSFELLKGRDYLYELNGKQYFYTAIDQQPVNKVMDYKDICCRVADNSTANSKLIPLVETIATDFATGIKKVDDSFIGDFENLMYDLRYGPGMLDPKTIGYYSVDLFSNNPALASFYNSYQKMTTKPIDFEMLKRLQNLQNINQPISFTARELMTDGINTFMRYFGVFDLLIPYDFFSSSSPLGDRESLQKQAKEIEWQLLTGKITELPTFINQVKTYLQFIEDETRTLFQGVRFNLSNGIMVELYIGDTTIENITQFVNFFHCTIPYDIEHGREKEMKESWKRLHHFAKVILDGIDPEMKSGFLKGLSSVGEDPKNLLLTEILITLKSFGDSLQVYYSRRLGEYLRKPELGNMSLFISSTDKNVGGESLFVNNDFMIVGTGIRPHSDFFQKYTGFFGKISFQNAVQGLPTVQGETDCDGTKTITTNKNLLDENKIWNHIRCSLLQIADSIDFTQVNESESMDETQLIEILLNPQLNNGIFSDLGKEKLNQLLNEYRLIKDVTKEEKNNPRVIKTLLAMDDFLQKTANILQLCQPLQEAILIPDEETRALNDSGKIRTVFFEKLSTLKSFIQTKFLTLISSLSSSNIVKKRNTYEKIVEEVQKGSNYQNIYDTSLIDFSVYLDNKYKEIIQESINDYQELMRETQEEMGQMMTQFFKEHEKLTATSNQSNRTHRSSAVISKEKALEKTISQERDFIASTHPELKALDYNVEKVTLKLNQLISKYGQKKKRFFDFRAIAQTLGIKKTDQQMIANNQKKLEEYVKKRDIILKKIESNIRSKIKQERANNDPVLVSEMVKNSLIQTRDRFQFFGKEIRNRAEKLLFQVKKPEDLLVVAPKGGKSSRSNKVKTMKKHKKNDRSKNRNRHNKGKNTGRRIKRTIKYKKRNHRTFKNK